MPLSNLDLMVVTPSTGGGRWAEANPIKLPIAAKKYEVRIVQERNTQHKATQGNQDVDGELFRGEAAVMYESTVLSSGSQSAS